MADMDRVLEIECFGQRREIIGVGVQVVAAPGLARAAMAAAIMGDAAVATGSKTISRAELCPVAPFPRDMKGIGPADIVGGATGS
jgi:hypothetical protein